MYCFLNILWVQLLSQVLLGLSLWLLLLALGLVLLSRINILQITLWLSLHNSFIFKLLVVSIVQRFVQVKISLLLIVLKVLQLALWRLFAILVQLLLHLARYILYIRVWFCSHWLQLLLGLLIATKYLGLPSGALQSGLVHWHLLVGGGHCELLRRLLVGVSRVNSRLVERKVRLRLLLVLVGVQQLGSVVAHH